MPCHGRHRQLSLLTATVAVSDNKDTNSRRNERTDCTAIHSPFGFAERCSQQRAIDITDCRAASLAISCSNGLANDDGNSQADCGADERRTKLQAEHRTHS